MQGVGITLGERLPDSAGADGDVALHQPGDLPHINAPLGQILFQRLVILIGGGRQWLCI